jgi:hypothetical protein
MQTKLAKSHGIYGFAIYFDLLNLNYSIDKIINFFLNTLCFPVLLIWKNDEFEILDDISIGFLFNNIRKYLISNNYIKIKQKPILSILNPYKFYNISYIISIMRKEAKKKKIGELFIIYPFSDDYKKKIFLNSFDAIYDLSNIDLLEHTRNSKNILYYSGFVYKNSILNGINLNFSLFRSCYLNSQKFTDYNPEKFYILNNIVFEHENTNKKENYGILFVDAWNDYGNGNYLERDEKYGYASINSFSKSIFKLPYLTNKNYFYINNNEMKIAIQIHAFYEDVFVEIMNKLNSINIKMDLYITTINQKKKNL